MIHVASDPEGTPVNLYLRLLLMTLRTRAGRGDRPLSIWDTAATAFRVAPTDLDVLGHMNNGRYLTIMDLARLDLMTRSGFWARLRRRGWYPVVAGQTISYRRSLTLGQRFTVHTRVLGLDERWIYLEQTFAVGADLYAQAAVRARFLRRGGGSVSHGEVLELTGPLPAGREVPGWLLEWSAGSKPARTWEQPGRPGEEPADRA